MYDGKSLIGKNLGIQRCKEKWKFFITLLARSGAKSGDFVTKRGDFNKIFLKALESRANPGDYEGLSQSTITR